MTVELRTLRYGSSGPAVLITGGVHGDEFEPILAIRQLAELFDSRNPLVAGFSGRLTLVPIVNEPAFLRGHRCGDDGLDLARTCPGRVDGTLTERIAFELSRLIRQADYYIDLHTGGTELSVLPLAGYMMHEVTAVLEVQRRMARAFGLPFVWGTAANLNGRSLSVARDAGIPAIYCEYLGSAACAASGVECYVSGCLNVMGELGLLNRTPPTGGRRDVVEDTTPDSGHLQICNPAPVTGCWEPLVSLGNSVQQSEQLGRIHPLEGGQAIPVCAEQSGRVIVLRTFPRVLAGQSVGVIVATP